MTLDHPRGRWAARSAVLLLLETLFLATSPVPSHAAASTPVGVPSETRPAAATPDAERHAEALASRLVGEARSQAGLPPLRSSVEVAAVARARAVDMRDRGYFTHVGPDGTDAFDLLDRSGIAWAAGSEAIGWNTVEDADGSAERVVADWLASPEHRELLLARDRDAIGIAAAVDPATRRRTWVAVLIAVPAPLPPAVAVRIVRVGRPDAAGKRTVTVAWSPTPTSAASSNADRPAASVTVQVRRAGGAWATAVVSTTRTTLRLRVRAPDAFEVRVRTRGPGGAHGPWSTVRFRP